MAKKKEEKEDVFFVGLKDPVEIRRAILESSKELVQYLQRSERFKRARKEKAEEIAKLKQIMHEISTLMRKLKSSLPKTNLRTKLGKHEKEQKKKEEIDDLVKNMSSLPKEKAEKARAPSELEKLEAELGEIESRLGKMS